MFTDIGAKIKAWAMVVTWVGIIVSIISGIMIIGSGKGMVRYNESNPMLMLGIMVIVAGSLASWVSSFTLYGFGQLIGHAASIDDKLNNLFEKHVKISENPSKPNQGKETKNKPPIKEKTAEIVSQEKKTVRVDRSQEMTVCPFCKTRQRADRDICFHCLAEFVDSNVEKD